MSYQDQLAVHYCVTYNDEGADVRAEVHNDEGLYFSNNETVVVDDPFGALAHHAAYNEPREWSRDAYLTDAGVRVEIADRVYVPYLVELKTVVADVTAELDDVVGAWATADES